MTSTTKLPVVLLAGLSLAGALAGCSTPAPAADAGTGGSTDGGGSDAPAGDYEDGTYSATGTYQAPSGTESVEVTVTLEGNVITDLEVVGDATDPQAQLHQGQFIDGIDAVVVGKNIDELQVDKVGGSSLTSGGFNQAIEQIKAEAAA